MIDEVNDMDYYSGAPEPTDYNFDDNGNPARILHKKQTFTK